MFMEGILSLQAKWNNKTHHNSTSKPSLVDWALRGWSRSRAEKSIWSVSQLSKDRKRTPTRWEPILSLLCFKIINYKYDTCRQLQEKRFMHIPVLEPDIYIDPVELSLSNASISYEAISYHQEIK